MDGQTVALCVLMAAQLYSAAGEVRSLLDDEDVAGHFQTLSTNAVSVISTLLTAACSVRLRRARRSLYRAERSLCRTGDRTPDGRRRRPCTYRPAVLTSAVVVYGFLKYGQLADDERRVDDPWTTTAAVALLRTVSAAGNYYVTVMFVDHVILTRRVLHELNAWTEDAADSVSTVSTARLTYLNVCDNCVTVTKAFQTQLFINIVGNVFGVTFMVLSAFNVLMSDGANSIWITMYYLYDSLVRTLQMYFIIDACHTTVEQIQLFVLEMLDHKIEFIIYGFICLDFDMFVSIMGIIATYLLILVQLGSSPDVLDSNSTTTFNMTSPFPVK